MNEIFQERGRDQSCQIKRWIESGKNCPLILNGNVMANHGLQRISFGEDMRLKALLEYVQEKVKRT